MENSEGEATTINDKQQEDMYSSTNNNDKHENSNFKDSSKSLYNAISSLLFQIFFPDSHSSSSSFFERTKTSFTDNLPHIREASTATGLNVLHWVRQGSTFRLLLVISKCFPIILHVGTITLLTLTGVLLFSLFIAAATINAIILSLFVSLAAAGGFFAIFFACVAAVYIGALSVAVIVISSATISAIITIIVVTGWIGFLWSLWLVIKKSASFAKHSVTVTGSALSAYTSGQRALLYD